MITGFADGMFSSVCAPFLFVSICSCGRFLLQCIGAFLHFITGLQLPCFVAPFVFHALFFFHGQILQFLSFFMGLALFLVAFSPLSLFYWLCRTHVFDANPRICGMPRVGLARGKSAGQASPRAALAQITLKSLK